MELSEEDSLRLHVLAQTSLAIRIDEAQMAVIGLGEAGEHRVKLNPSHQVDRYLRSVREMLSTMALGTPGGYPVFIRRWTRSGALEAERLGKLLCLGEPEAVVAVAASPELTDALALKAWWCLPTAETARLMLRHVEVVHGKTGPLLVRFLLEQLPFETTSRDIIDTLRLILRSNLLDEHTLQHLRARAEKKVAYLVGFLSAGPAYVDPDRTRTHKRSLNGDGPSFNRAPNDPLPSTASMQRYLKACAHALEKATDMDIVVDTVTAIGAPFQDLRPAIPLPRSAPALQQAVSDHLALLMKTESKTPETAGFLDLSRTQQEAILILSLTGEPLVAPVFARTDATGSLMRKKLAEVLTPVIQALATLTSDEVASSSTSTSTST